MSLRGILGTVYWLRLPLFKTVQITFRDSLGYGFHSYILQKMYFDRIHTAQSFCRKMELLWHY